MELKKDKMIIWEHTNIMTGKMHLSSILYCKWKINDNRIESSMDSVYEYDDLKGNLFCIIRPAKPDSNYSFEYFDNESHPRAYSSNYNRTLLLLRDTSLTINILTRINSPCGEWQSFKKIK